MDVTSRFLDRLLCFDNLIAKGERKSISVA